MRSIEEWHDLANIVEVAMGERHRGVFSARGRLVVFGNDGYKGDPRTRHQVKLMHEWLADHGYTVEELLLSGSEYSWVLVVKKPSDKRWRPALDQLRAAVWGCFLRARGFHELADREMRCAEEL